MASVMAIRQAAALVQLTTTEEVSVVVSGVRSEVARRRRDGLRSPAFDDLLDVVADLERLAAIEDVAATRLPTSEEGAEVSTDPTSEDRWWTTSETASHLGAAGVRGGDRWVRQLLREGVLTGCQRGRQWFVDPESVTAHINERTAA